MEDKIRSDRHTPNRRLLGATRGVDHRHVLRPGVAEIKGPAHVIRLEMDRAGAEVLPLFGIRIGDVTLRLAIDPPPRHWSNGTSVARCYAGGNIYSPMAFSTVHSTPQARAPYQGRRAR